MVTGLPLTLEGMLYTGGHKDYPQQQAQQKSFLRISRL